MVVCQPYDDPAVPAGQTRIGEPQAAGVRLVAEVGTGQPLTSATALPGHTMVGGQVGVCQPYDNAQLPAGQNRSGKPRAVAYVLAGQLLFVATELIGYQAVVAMLAGPQAVVGTLASH